MLDFFKNKNKNTIIRIQKKEYKGYEFYDFRQFYRQESESLEEDWKPTKKGFAISVEKFPEFIKELNKFVDKVCR